MRRGSSRPMELFCVRFFASLSAIHRGQLTRWRFSSLSSHSTRHSRLFHSIFPVKKVTHFSSCGCRFFVVNSVSMTLPYSLSGEAASLCVCVHCACASGICDEVAATLPLRPHLLVRHARHMLTSSASLRKKTLSHVVRVFLTPSPCLEHVTRAPSRQASTVLSEGRFAADEGKSHSD